MAFALINTFNITDDANLEINGAVNPIAAFVGGTPFLFVPGADDDGLTVFKITAKRLQDRDHGAYDQRHRRQRSDRCFQRAGG